MTRASSVALEGTTLRIRMAPALPSDPSVLAVAVALRLLARYPVVDRVVLGDHATEMGFTREQIERLLDPEGFAALDVPGAWSDILARTMRRLASPDADEPSPEPRSVSPEVSFGITPSAGG